jgi:hypothetical protein
VFQSFCVAWYAGELEAGSLQPCSVEHSTEAREHARLVITQLEAWMRAPQLLSWLEPE